MDKHSRLDALETALRAEREALAGADPEALLRSTAAKLAALDAVGGLAPEAEDAPRIAALAAYNRENGLLLSRHRRAVAFALRQLGHTEACGYGPRGQHAQQGWQRPIAVA
ncbi:MAG: flagellar protein FlgN [Xanthomonadaceae bacterium]|jgi:hypothetical protein|nr:flagellar protein FlgN [Xanthomonadaceae bacterium]